MKTNAEKLKEFCDYSLKNATEKQLEVLVRGLMMICDAQAEISNLQKKNPNKAYACKYYYQITEVKINA